MKTALLSKFFLSSALVLLGWCNPGLIRSEETVVTNHLPAVLHDAEGKEVDAASLKGKHIGLYFSAHWCPPCRAFTPSLVKFRDENADKDFEIIFVSMDKSTGEKKNYIREMGMKWLTVPGANTKEVDALARKFEIRGIPALIILAPDGSLVTPDGREDVMLSPEAALNKWKGKNPS